MALRLRKIKEKDLQMIMEWRMKPEVTRYMYTDPVLDMEKQQKWFKEISKDETSRYWIVEFDNVSIGVISLTDIDLKNRRCSWAYYIADTSYRGKGIATLLECNIYDYVFDNLNLNKLCSEVFKFNDKVIEIHKKFGSEVEGLLQQHIYKKDQFYDVVVMGIVKDKWQKIKKNYKYEKISME